MDEKVPGPLNGWVEKFHWDEVVLGTTYQTGPRGLRSLWRNGYMANQHLKITGIRLVRNVTRTEDEP